MPLVLVALVCGTIFGAGLTVSGMVDPSKILNFLDFAGIASGRWDPTLAVVFAGAVAAMAVGVGIRQGLTKPLAAAEFSVPANSGLDARLLGGAVLFGVGWGIAGLCPGPAIASLAVAGGQLTAVIVFIAALVAGVVLSWMVPK